MNSAIYHYYNILLPLISALDVHQSLDMVEAVKEMDYLIETLSHSELNELEKEETELTYWAWWEKIRHDLLA